MQFPLLSVKMIEQSFICTRAHQRTKCFVGKDFVKELKNASKNVNIKMIEYLANDENVQN